MRVAKERLGILGSAKLVSLAAHWQHGFAKEKAEQLQGSAPSVRWTSPRVIPVFILWQAKNSRVGSHTQEDPDAGRSAHFSRALTRTIAPFR